MKISKLLVIICGLMILLTSCDCFVRHQGYVRDSRTEKPIQGATVRFDKREYMTDSLGYFEIAYMTGFCPDREFQIEKQHYKTENLKIELADNEIIFRVSETAKDDQGMDSDNSLNFKIKDDTIHFLLTESKYKY